MTSGYTKTGLVFGFSKNQILVAVIPGLKNAEDFPRTKGAEDFTRAKLVLDFSENHFEMSIIQKEGTKVTTKGASDFNEWATAIWRFLKSLTITAIGVTLIYLVCRWLIS